MGSAASTPSAKGDPPLHDEATFDVKLKIQYMRDDRPISHASVPTAMGAAFAAYLSSPRFATRVRKQLDSVGSAYQSSINHHYTCSKAVMAKPGVVRVTFKKLVKPKKIKASVRDGSPTATVGALKRDIEAALKLFGRAADPLLVKKHHGQELWFRFDEVHVRQVRS